MFDILARGAGFSPQGEQLEEYRLPVRCPTMVCFWRRRYENAVYYNYQKYVCSGSGGYLRRHLLHLRVSVGMKKPFLLNVRRFYRRRFAG